MNNHSLSNLAVASLFLAVIFVMLFASWLFCGIASPDSAANAMLEAGAAATAVAAVVVGLAAYASGTTASAAATGFESDVT